MMFLPPTYTESAFASDERIEAVVARILHRAVGEIGSIARDQEIRVGGEAETRQRIQFAFRPRIPVAAPVLVRRGRRVADVNVLDRAEDAVAVREDGALPFPVGNHELQSGADMADRITLVHVDPVLAAAEGIGLLLVVDQKLGAHQLPVGRVRRAALKTRILLIPRIIRRQRAGIVPDRDGVRLDIHRQNGPLAERRLPVLQHQIAHRDIPAGIHEEARRVGTAEEQFRRFRILPFDQCVFQLRQTHMAAVLLRRLSFRRNKAVEEITF